MVDVKKTASKPETWITICCVATAAFEGLSATKYYDSVGVATICYGATAADHVDLSKVYTKAECTAMLGRDLVKYDAELKKCIDTDTLPPSRHAALVSLAYNIGPAGVCRSSIIPALKAGRVQQACDDFLAFNHAGGRVLAGLTKRRQAERLLCLKSEPVAPAPKTGPAPPLKPQPQHGWLWHLWHWLVD